MRAHDRRLAAKAASAEARDSFVDDPKIATVVECQSRPIMNLLLELMAFAIWFLINHLGPFTLPPLCGGSPLVWAMANEPSVDALSITLTVSACVEMDTPTDVFWQGQKNGAQWEEKSTDHHRARDLLHRKAQPCLDQPGGDPMRQCI